MAGNHVKAIHLDPAIVKWNNMIVNRHKYFRWTPRTAWITFAYAVAVPGVLAVIGYQTEGKWDMRGKRRGDLVSEF